MRDAHTADSFKLYNLAAMYYRKATETDSGNKIAWIKRGENYMKRQDLDSGTWCFSKAIFIDTLFAEAYYKRALSLKWNEGELPIADLTKAIQLKPNYGEAYRERASKWLQLKKDTSNALADYSKALESLNDDYGIYEERGKIYAAKKEFQKALDDFTKGLAIAPNSYNLYYERALANYDLHYFKAAIADFTSAINIYGDGYAYYGRARAKFEMGDIEGARKDKTMSIEIDEYATRQKDSIPYP